MCTEQWNCFFFSFFEVISLFWFFSTNKIAGFPQRSCLPTRKHLGEKGVKSSAISECFSTVSHIWVSVTLRRPGKCCSLSPGHWHQCQGTAPLQDASGDSALRVLTPLLSIRPNVALWGIFAWMHCSHKCFLSLCVSSSPCCGRQTSVTTPWKERRDIPNS